MCAIDVGQSHDSGGEKQEELRDLGELKTGEGLGVAEMYPSDRINAVSPDCQRRSLFTLKLLRVGRVAPSHVSISKQLSLLGMVTVLPSWCVVRQPFLAYLIVGDRDLSLSLSRHAPPAFLSRDLSLSLSHAQSSLPESFFTSFVVG